MDFQALVIAALLMRASVSVSGSSEELSTTTGDTVHIPCLFGEGTLRNIYWYYNDGTGPVKILTFFKGTVTKGGAYVYRASLHDDNSTLILTDITVKDEGTYRCDVDRQGQTAVPNVNTKLYVFSLTRDSLPKIAECTEIDESSACNIHSNKSITVRCELRNVYPVEDAELTWYQDEQHVPSTGNPKPNDDGTYDIIAPIEVIESGNFTCNATFFTAEGAWNAAVYVGVRITPEPDDQDAPEKGLSEGDIAGIVVGLVLFAVACLVIIIIIVLRKMKGHHTSLNNSGFEEMEPLAGRTSTNRNPSLVTEDELESLSHRFPHNEYTKMCHELGYMYNESHAILTQHKDDYQKALMEVFMKWKNHTGGHRKELVDAMKGANAGGLVENFSETTIFAGPKDKNPSSIQRSHKTSKK